MAEEIESQKMLLGEDALATKVQEFEKKRAEYFQFREGIDQRAEQEYNAKISPILDQVKTIVERLGKERRLRPGGGRGLPGACSTSIRTTT